MKQLTDNDFEEMIDAEFVPDDKQIRRSLKLAPIPVAAADTTTATRHIDLHNHTVEQSWKKLSALIHSGARRAVIITGASGILKTKFQEWMEISILAPHIHSWRPLNNGSFEIQIRCRKLNTT